MAIDPITVAKLWMVVKPIKRLKERRKAKRAERNGQASPVETKEVSMFQGKLTYTGVAVLGLSWLFERFGVPVAPEELEGAVAAVIAAVGAAAAIYGRWRATRKPV